MLLFLSILLGIVQGLTEFLPISSSGHIVVAKKIFSLQSSGASLETLLHFGTLIAVIFFYRKDWFDIFKTIIHRDRNSTSLHFLGLLFIASIPAGVVGLFFKNTLESTFHSLNIVIIGLFVTSAVLISTIFIKQKGNFKWNVVNALIVGIAQAVAILPGISRSGATIVTGLWLGAKPDESARFSFMLAVPAMLGATLLEIKNIINIAYIHWEYIIASIVSMIFGFIALAVIVPIMRKKKLWLLGIYCASIAIITLFYASECSD